MKNLIGQTFGKVFAIAAISLLLSSCVHNQPYESALPELLVERTKRAAEIKALILKADIIELFSLDPFIDKQFAFTGPADRFIAGFGIIGYAKTKDSLEIGAVANALEKDLTTDAVSAKCFIPRHAIRFIDKGSTIEIVICYHCSAVNVYREGKEYYGGGISGYGERFFDSLFEKHGLPLVVFPKTKK